MTLSHPRANDSDEHCDLAVIGAVQAGLAIGYFLKRHGLRFLILEADSIASAWRKRWESLTLSRRSSMSPQMYDQAMSLSSIS